MSNLIEFVERVLNALINVHPWHVVTVHFPIALTGAALLFLVLALWQRSEVLERAAFYNIMLAAIGTAVAGLTGYRDYIVRFEGEAPLINLKIFLAITLLVLTVGITINRWRQPEILWKPTTMVLYLAAFGASFAIAAVLGFVGGVILYGF